MRNLYAEPASHKNLAYGLGIAPAVVLIVIFSLIKILIKYAVKFKNQLWKFSVTMSVVFFLTAFFMPVVYSPYASAEVPVYGDKSEHDQIASYIVEVFGKDAPKAFQLLSCENSSLSPDAVNTVGNHPAGSRDIGVFQINEYWQKTQGKFLFNWKVNVEIAYQLYSENGNSFKLWSCGKRMGI